MKFKLYILSILLFVFYASIASNSEKHGLSFIENKGQWEDNILFQANLPNGKIYLEDSCLTFLIYDKEDFDKIHDAHHGHYSPGEDGFLIKCHAFKMYFDNSNTNSIKTSSFVQHDYVNYFIGNDKRKWASKVQKYGMVTYENIFNNIDFKIY